MVGEQLCRAAICLRICSAAAKRAFTHTDSTSMRLKSQKTMPTDSSTSHRIEPVANLFRRNTWMRRFGLSVRYFRFADTIDLRSADFEQTQTLKQLVAATGQQIFICNRIWPVPTQDGFVSLPHSSGLAHGVVIAKQRPHRCFAHFHATFSIGA